MQHPGMNILAAINIWADRRESLQSERDAKEMFININEDDTWDEKDIKHIDVALKSNNY